MSKGGVGMGVGHRCTNWLFGSVTFSVVKKVHGLLVHSRVSC